MKIKKVNDEHDQKCPGESEKKGSASRVPMTWALTTMSGANWAAVHQPSVTFQMHGRQRTGAARTVMAMIGNSVRIGLATAIPPATATRSTIRAMPHAPNLSIYPRDTPCTDWES